MDAVQMNAKRTAMRRRATAWALGLSAVLSLSGVAQACTSARGGNPPNDKTHATYPDVRERWMGQLLWSLQLTGCDRDFVVDVKMDMPGLTYVGDIVYRGVAYPAYEAAPDSALLIFLFQRVVGFTELPLQPGVTAPYPVRLSEPGGVSFNLRPQYFSRGGRMRSFSGSGTFSWHLPLYPELDGDHEMNYSITFPATTCPLQDNAETLQDVQVAELLAPGGTAKEKLVAIRMDCGIDPPRARMTLSDAGDATNTGSQLTPTVDSDAEGVRVQLLRNGSEVQFGQTWNFDPGVGGVHDHQFTARYIRTSDALVPGTIKGEAVLNVDYW